MTLEEYLRYAASLYKQKELFLLDELKELNTSPEDVFHNIDLINLEETIHKIKFKKVRLFSNSIAESGKILLDLLLTALSTKKNLPTFRN